MIESAEIVMETVTGGNWIKNTLDGMQNDFAVNRVLCVVWCKNKLHHFAPVSKLVSMNDI